MGWELKDLKKQSCGKCHYKEEIGNRYGSLVIKEFAEVIPRKDENGGRSYFLCQCDCGNLIKVEYSHLKCGHTQSCGCTKISQGEELIALILNEHNISYKREITFPDLKDKDFLRYDFALLNEQEKPYCLVEFDGPQHIKGHDFTLDKDFDQDVLLKHDEMKNQYALEHNIPLIRIPYKDKKKDKIEKYLNNYL